jgi:hypothetical protein
MLAREAGCRHKETRMPAPVVLRCLLAAIAIGAACCASAQRPEPGRCEIPTSEAGPLADREGLLARFEQLPQSCLREIVNTCTRAASRTLLDFGSAATCSFGYEALLRQGFGGDFSALMAWWQSQASDAGPQ